MAGEDDVADIGVDGVIDARQIGSGAFGRVYRARQESLDRTVAVKVLANVDLDEEARQRFDREGRAVGALSGHPNIVAVHQQGVTDGGNPYLMMEFCTGGSCGDRVRSDGAMTWQESTEVAIAIAGALETAHRAGILHRDVKPDNILIDAYDTPKLADFGIARVSKSAHLTATGTLTGSPAHMPPELIAGKSATPASDVYSLASTVYAMITGRAAFVRDSDESIVPMLQRISFEEADPLEDHGVPHPIARVIARAMAKDPTERQASCQEFGNDLNRARQAAGAPPAPMKVQGERRVDPDATLASTMAPPDTTGDLGPQAHTGPAPFGVTGQGWDQGPTQQQPTWPQNSSGPSAPSADSLHGATNPFARATFDQASFGQSSFGPSSFGPSSFAQSPFSQSGAGVTVPSPPPQPAKKRPVWLIAGGVGVLVIILVVAGLAFRGTGSSGDHGSTGLLVDGKAAGGHWIPTNAVKFDPVTTPCGTVPNAYERIEGQGFRPDGATTPQWATMGAPAASDADAQRGFEQWDAAFAGCPSSAQGAEDVTPLSAPNLPCNCDESTAWSYTTPGGQPAYIGMVRKGSMTAGVVVQAASGADEQDLFTELLAAAAERVEAVG